jgi:alpha-mannosidase
MRNNYLVKIILMKTNNCYILFFLFLTIINSQNIIEAQKTAYYIATAHFDTQWNWTVQNSISDALKETLVKNFALFEKYPQYTFSFEGAVKYSWMKEYYPAAYDKLKSYIAQGRWHVAGSSWDANDVNIPSAESLIRNILMGQTFYKKEFGIKSSDIMLPDCFGFGFALPTIAKHCGLNGFHSQKLSWGSSVGIPFKVGVWQGVDGSQIMAALDPGDYYASVTEDLSNAEWLMDEIDSTGNTTGEYIAFRYFGTGDFGGAPDEPSVDWIEKSIAGPGPITLKNVGSDYIFNLYGPADLSKFKLWNSELLMSTHGTGCYTSQAAMKRWNRKNELLADETEKSSVIADWLGGLPYQLEKINSSWNKIIWHQFHDDLTGTSIPKAYVYSWNDEILAQNELSNVFSNASGAVIRGLNTQVTGIPIVVFNPLSIERNDIVEATIDLASEPGNIKVYNKLGDEVPVQIISYKNKKLKFVFVASVSSLGYEVFDFHTSESAPPNNPNLKIGPTSIENINYKVTVNENGDVNSIFDKRFSKELISEPLRLALFYDPSYDWPAWEVTYNTINSEPRAYVDGTPTIEIEEAGPVRVTLKISREKDGSLFIQHLQLCGYGSTERIDFVAGINWNTTKTLLKAVFPFTYTNSKATYDLGIGTIERGNNTSKLYEVPAQQWADLTATDNSYGISILNDCKYGWDKPTDNTLRLSLLHTPETRGDYVYQQNQDIGSHTFTYSIYSHSREVLDGNTQWESMKLNQPLVSFIAPKHQGNIGKTFSFASTSSKQFAVKALKHSELSDDYVLRVYELNGKSLDNASIKFASNLLSAKELNGIEEETGTVTYASDSITFSLSAYQPKTFSFRLNKPDVEFQAPSFVKVELPYDADVMTYDTNRSDGNFDGKKNSYAAELIPDTLSVDGVKFCFGPRGNKENNALRCKGNKITLPSGSYSKIYILAASSSPLDQHCVFDINGSQFIANVPYYSGNIGTWATYSGAVKKEKIGFTGTHLHNPNGNSAYTFTYMFQYSNDLPVGYNTLTLPNNPNITLFAVSLSDNTNDDVTPGIELRDIPKSITRNDSIPDFPYNCIKNISLNKAATASGECSTNDDAAMAFDGDPTTEWCHSTTGDCWLQVDLGDTSEICRYRILHAGFAQIGTLTKSFVLQIRQDSIWITVDKVGNNAVNITDRFINPVKTRFIRLNITNSGNYNTALIYEFEIFGEQILTTEVKTRENNEEINIYPVPSSDIIYITSKVLMNQISVLSLSGSVILNRNIESNSEQIDLSNLQRGMYLVRILQGDTFYNRKIIVQ